MPESTKWVEITSEVTQSSCFNEINSKAFKFSPDLNQIQISRLFQVKKQVYKQILYNLLLLSDI